MSRVAATGPPTSMPATMPASMVPLVDVTQQSVEEVAAAMVVMAATASQPLQPSQPLQLSQPSHALHLVGGEGPLPLRKPQSPANLLREKQLAAVCLLYACCTGCCTCCCILVACVPYTCCMRAVFLLYSCCMVVVLLLCGGCNGKAPRSGTPHHSPFACTPKIRHAVRRRQVHGWRADPSALPGTLNRWTSELDVRRVRRERLVAELSSAIEDHHSRLETTRERARLVTCEAVSEQSLGSRWAVVGQSLSSC